MFYEKGRCFPSKKRTRGDVCALGMMFWSGGMVLLGQGNNLSYVHDSNVWSLSYVYTWF
jgi:hypothetical protein